uniref:Gamma-glutamylcyclotransferase family protein n=1 Tax=Panagrellus redivivus TaxID=6233 RepID=A0A7E4ZUD9_PANRE
MWVFSIVCLQLALQLVGASGSEMRTKVFVYGTLKKGEPNHEFMTDPATGKLWFIDNATTVDKFVMFVSSPRNIPFIVNSEEKNEGYQIKGELYEVDDQKLAILDDIERFYTKIDIDVTDSKDVIHAAKIYVLPKTYPKLEANKTMNFDNYYNGIEGRWYIEPNEKVFDVPSSDWLEEDESTESTISF